jgi:hypothetical protein
LASRRRFVNHVPPSSVRWDAAVVITMFIRSKRPPAPSPQSATSAVAAAFGFPIADANLIDGFAGDLEGLPGSLKISGSALGESRSCEQQHLRTKLGVITGQLLGEGGKLLSAI